MAKAKTLANPFPVTPDHQERSSRQNNTLHPHLRILARTRLAIVSASRRNSNVQAAHAPSQDFEQRAESMPTFATTVATKCLAEGQKTNLRPLWACSGADTTFQDAAKTPFAWPALAEAL